MIRNVKKKIFAYSCLELVSLVISIITIFMLIVLTNYPDTNALLRTHIFWDVLFDGKLVHFYDNFTKSNIHNCNLLARLPLLIWYFPSWVVTQLFSNESSWDKYVTFYHQVWHKLFLVIIYLICIKTMTEICKKMGGEEKKHFCWLLMTVSPSVILSVFYSGQDEIVYITLFLYALQKYLEGNRKKYYFWAIWSVVCCSLMLMPYLMIIIIDDKKIYSIIAKFVLPFIPQCLYTMFFSRCLTYKYTASDNFLDWYFAGNTIDMRHGAFSILVVLIIIIFVFAYLYRPIPEDFKGKIKVILYFCTILFMALEIIGWDQFYRRFLWVPFAVLLVINLENFSYKVCFSIMIVIDIIQSILIMYDINITLNYKTSYIAALIKKILGEIRYHRNSLFLSEKGIEITVLNSIMTACFIMFFNFSRRKYENGLELQINPVFIIFLSSLIVPYFLLYSFLCAYVIK